MIIMSEEKTNFYKNLGAMLKQFREEKGWDLEQASEKTKFGTKKLARIESGDRQKMNRMPLGNLISLAGCYDKMLKLSGDNPQEIPIEDILTNGRLLQLLHRHLNP